MSGGERLWTLPIAAAVTLMVAAVLLFAPVGVLAAHGGGKAVLIAGVIVAAFTLTTVSTFFSVAFLGQVEAHIDGRAMSAREGLGFARGRLRAIVGWSLLTTAVGVAVRALEQLSGGDLVARLIRVVGELAWSLATFFVVPVLALENVGPVEALKRSVTTFRKRWGEQVTGDLVIGGASMLAMFASMMLALTGLVVAAVYVPVLGVLLIVAGLGGAFATVVVTATISKVFSLVVYRYATGRPVPAPFTEADVTATFKPKKR
jgi:hypothetical protein